MKSIQKPVNLPIYGLIGVMEIVLTTYFYTIKIYLITGINQAA